MCANATAFCTYIVLSTKRVEIEQKLKKKRREKHIHKGSSERRRRVRQTPIRVREFDGRRTRLRRKRENQISLDDFADRTCAQKQHTQLNVLFSRHFWKGETFRAFYIYIHRLTARYHYFLCLLHTYTYRIRNFTGADALRSDRRCSRASAIIRSLSDALSLLEWLAESRTRNRPNDSPSRLPCTFSDGGSLACADDDDDENYIDQTRSDPRHTHKHIHTASLASSNLASGIAHL